MNRTLIGFEPASHCDKTELSYFYYYWKLRTIYIDLKCDFVRYNYNYMCKLG